MLYFFKLLYLLINVDQGTILNWFEISYSSKQNISTESNELSDMVAFPSLSIKTFYLIIEGLLRQFQEGLTLADIENLLFIVLFIRFIILIIRYNLKTSFYITMIGLAAGYLWYRHLIDLIAMYRSMLLKLPYLHKLGIDAIQLSSSTSQALLTNLRLEDKVHWYNPGQLLYYAIIKGLTNVNTESGITYYIDPVSMMLSKLDDVQKEKLLPLYYKIYNKIIPQVFESISKFWAQLSGIAAYAVITRIGKKYCPYLIRWHWTFLLIVGFIEQTIIYFCYRISYFQFNVLIPQIELLSNPANQNLIFKSQILNGFLTLIICFHFGLIFFGLFHAIWGQYFYFPFLVENTELHIGPRPKNSIYSGGATSWQDVKSENIQRSFPKLWYGWFGRGTTNRKHFLYPFQNTLINITKQIKKFILIRLYKK